MKLSKKMAKRAEARKAEYDKKQNDPRISSTWKHSSRPPGSEKRKK